MKTQPEPWHAPTITNGARIDAMLAHIRANPGAWYTAHYLGPAEAHDPTVTLAELLNRRRQTDTLAYRLELDRAWAELRRKGRYPALLRLRIVLDRTVRGARWADTRLENITSRNSKHASVRAAAHGAGTYLLARDTEPDPQDRLWVIAAKAFANSNSQPTAPAGSREPGR